MPGPKTLRPLAPALALLGLSCLPYPHVDHLAPDLSGSIRMGRGPVQGVAVEYRVPHAGYDETGASSPEGTFSIEGPKRMSYFIVFGDRFDTWTITFVLSPETRLVLQDRGMWGGPSRLVVDCELLGELHPPFEIPVPQKSTHRESIVRDDLRCTFQERSRLDP